MSTPTNPLGLDGGSGVASRFAWRSLLASPGLPASLLCWAGSVLLILSSVIHFHLWSDGYRQIATIGPLFLAQAIAGIVIALVVAISRHFILALAGALFAAGTIAGLIVSVEVGLFGFKDSFSAPYATVSLVIEAAAFAVLVAAALIGIRHATTGAHQPAGKPDIQWTALGSDPVDPPRSLRTGTAHGNPARRHQTEP